MKRYGYVAAALLTAAFIALSACSAPELDFPPSVSISEPTDGTTVSGSFTLRGSASDDMGLSRVEYSLDNGATFAAASGTASWSATVDSTTVPDGGLPIMARSTDSAATWRMTLSRLSWKTPIQPWKSSIRKPTTWLSQVTCP